MSVLSFPTEVAMANLPALGSTSRAIRPAGDRAGGPPGTGQEARRS